MTCRQILSSAGRRYKYTSRKEVNFPMINQIISISESLNKIETCCSNLKQWHKYQNYANEIPITFHKQLTYYWTFMTVGEKGKSSNTIKASVDHNSACKLQRLWTHLWVKLNVLIIPITDKTCIKWCFISQPQSFKGFNFKLNILLKQHQLLLHTLMTNKNIMSLLTPLVRWR